jgi:hypothetical protein
LPASVGIYADLHIDGNGYDGLGVTVGLTDCYGTKCGKDVPVIGGLDGIFPYTILDSTLYFYSCPKPKSTMTKILIDLGITAAVLFAIGLAHGGYKKVKAAQQKKEGALLGNEYSAMGGDRA